MLLARAQNFQAKGSWRAASTCMRGRIRTPVPFWGQHPPVAMSTDEYTRGFGKDVLGRCIQPRYRRKCHVIPSINSLEKRFGTAPASLFPSQSFFPLILFFCSLEMCYPSIYWHHSLFTFSDYFYGATLLKHLLLPSFPFLPLNYIWSYSFTHKEEKPLAWLLEGVGNRLLWLLRNLFPRSFEDVFFEGLHPSRLSKRHLK